MTDNRYVSQPRTATGSAQKRRSTPVLDDVASPTKMIVNSTLLSLHQNSLPEISCSLIAPNHKPGAALTAAVWRASPLNAPPRQSRVAGDKPSSSVKNIAIHPIWKHIVHSHTLSLGASPLRSTYVLLPPKRIRASSLSSRDFSSQ